MAHEFFGREQAAIDAQAAERRERRMENAIADLTYEIRCNGCGIEGAIRELVYAIQGREVV